MSRVWKIAGVIWGAFWAFVLVAATVPAKQAVSNLASWADFFGLTALAHDFAAKGLDYIGTALSVLSLAVLLVQTIILHRATDDLEKRVKALRDSLPGMPSHD